MSTRPWGALWAAALALGLTAAMPWRQWDRRLAARLAAALGTAGEAPVLVVVDPADLRLVAEATARARAAGATRVLGPAPPPTEGLVIRAFDDGAIREIDGRGLVAGLVPDELLRGETVLIDGADAGRRRAAAKREEVAPLAEERRSLLAGLAALLALATGLGVARLRLGPAAAVTAGTLALVAGLAVGAAAARRFVPAVELAAAVGLGLWLGFLDGALEGERVLETIAAPLLRATARARGAEVADPVAAIGPSLAELLGARALLLLSAPPGARRARVIAGFRLRESDLREDAPLDPRRPPFRDASGVARIGDGASLLDGHEGARLVPLRAGAAVEGYLLVVPARPGRPLEHTPSLVEGVATSLGRLLAVERQARAPASRLMRTLSGRGRRLHDAARALDEEAAALTGVVERAWTGLLVVSPAGMTRWKNSRFDEIIAQVAPAPAGDLARALSLFARPKETAAETLERLLGAEAPVRAASGTVVAAATVLRPAARQPPTAILVEVDLLDAALLAQMRPLASATTVTGKHRALSVVRESSAAGEAATSERML